MMPVLARNWWALVIRGVVAVLFGLAAFFWPLLTLAALVLLFGAYALVDGIFAIVAAVTVADPQARWWVLLIEGIVGILAAAVTFAWPGITALALLYVIAAWAVVTGVLQIVAAVRLRQEIDNEWLLGLSGIVSVLFGLYVAIFPGPGALAVVWVIGTYALITGVLFIALGLQLRGRQRRTPAHTTTERVGPSERVGAR
jgi:uncharacterized membrane protein HdeD (DUF308 family)